MTGTLMKMRLHAIAAAFAMALIQSARQALRPRRVERPARTRLRPTSDDMLLTRVRIQRVAPE